MVLSINHAVLTVQSLQAKGLLGFIHVRLCVCTQVHVHICTYTYISSKVIALAYVRFVKIYHIMFESICTMLFKYPSNPSSFFPMFNKLIVYQYN